VGAEDGGRNGGGGEGGPRVGRQLCESEEGRKGWKVLVSGEEILG